MDSTYQQLNFNYSPYVKQLQQFGEIQSRVNPLNSSNKWSQNLPPRTNGLSLNQQNFTNQLEADLLDLDSNNPSYRKSPMADNINILNQKSKSLIQNYNKQQQFSQQQNIAKPSSFINNTNQQQTSLFNGSIQQSSVYNSIKKKQTSQNGNNNNKIDFTDIMNQLSQPSSLETPFKDEKQMQQQFKYLICNSSELGDNYPEQDVSFKPPQEMFIQDQQNTYEVEGFEIHDGQGGNYEELRQQDLVIGSSNPSKNTNSGLQRIIFEIKDQSLADQSKQKKVNVKDMASQLDDLKDHIKCLEDKIEVTSKNMQTTKIQKDTSTTSLNRNNTSAFFKKSESFVNKKKIMTKDKKKGSASKHSSKKHQKNISWGESQLIQESTDEYGRRRSSMGVSSNKQGRGDQASKNQNKIIKNSQTSDANISSSNNTYNHNRIISEISNGYTQTSNRSIMKGSKIESQSLNLRVSSKNQRNKSLDSFSKNSNPITSSQTKKFNISIAGGVGSFINNAQKLRSSSKFDEHHNRRESGDGLSTYRMSSDFTCTGADVNRRFSDIEMMLPASNQKLRSRQNYATSLLQSTNSNNRTQSRLGVGTTVITDNYVNETQPSHLSQPQKQSQSSKQKQDQNYQSLSSKTKECEIYKQKCFKYQKKAKLLKSELQEKEAVINNFKNLHKELKTIKDQYRMSEDIRDQQTQQIKKLQAQIALLQKDNVKLKKKVQKMKDKEHMPIRVLIEERSSSNINPHQSQSLTNIDMATQKTKKKSVIEKSSS